MQNVKAMQAANSSLLRIKSLFGTIRDRDILVALLPDLRFQFSSAVAPAESSSEGR